MKRQNEWAGGGEGGEEEKGGRIYLPDCSKA